MAKSKGTTLAGYINRNNQKNDGFTFEAGTDYCQYLCKMKCLNCGHRYKAIGSDIFQRKCPGCQSGRP